MRDDSSHADDAAYRMTCRRVVQALIEKHDWALLHEDDLLESVLGSTQSEVSPTDLERKTRHHYTIALYEACRQAKDRDRRERGYHEMFRYLLRVAYNRWPELAEDATQRAMVLVYEQIDRCRNPGAFLAFAFYKLRQAFKQEQRARGKELPLKEVIQNSTKSERTILSLQLDQEELCQVLLEAIKRLLKDLVQKVIILKFFGGLSDAEISERLGITAGYVRVLRHRGIKRLRKDEHLRDYFNFEGANSEED